MLALSAVAGYVIINLLRFQINPPADLLSLGRDAVEQRYTLLADRGYIYDRNGAVLAAPGYDYEVAVEKQWMRYTLKRDLPESEVARLMATDIAATLSLTRSVVLEQLTSDSPRAILVQRADPEQVARLRALPYEGLVYYPKPRRYYPQGDLACHVLGYVNFDNIGGAGVEGYYNRELTGQAVSLVGSDVPSLPSEQVEPRRGHDLVLTIDRDVQAATEAALARAISEYRADKGSIVVLDPRTGAVLSMASTPCFSPYRFFDNTVQLNNPALVDLYEPGSVMKLITMAAGIDAGLITPDTGYFDSGSFVIGGQVINNAEQKSYGGISMRTALQWSVNTAHVWVAWSLGPERFYTYMERFGFGRLTNIDLTPEESGILNKPETLENWTEGMLAVNSFGQGVSVTALQMASAVSAIANDGRQMRPYVVQSIYQDGKLVAEHTPQVMSVPITAESAALVTAMAMDAGQQFAAIDGYTMAGKSGTAQIPVPGVGYHKTDVLGSFVGWLPADDPRFLILVRIDRPKSVSWGFQSAAPTWKALAEELIVLLDVPPDSIRLAQAQQP